jgi:hypothetical protein
MKSRHHILFHSDVCQSFLKQLFFYRCSFVLLDDISFKKSEKYVFIKNPSCYHKTYGYLALHYENLVFVFFNTVSILNLLYLLFKQNLLFTLQ